ncbi:hypothetical protein BJ322DRAFT_1070459 [Thelephora terrestris]|uniref:Uncharacterized protein n=1 Tax=Thelephora terrestris TaxID=56493 RepID=A0A9P6HE68_9AGAM|nr:hypothetical protein BJ322DRAFT_1070459 [Thelephora terrestris]
MSAHVPLEVWYLIADNLRQVELPPLLLVSRLHRLVALKRLFSHLKISFAYPQSGNTPYSLLEVTRDETRSLSWDMLSRVRCDKSFASAVQRITIYYSTEELRKVDRFHNGVVVEALKALTNLRSFAWVGNGLPLMDILENLPVCCPKLQEVSMIIDDTIALEYPNAPLASLKSMLYLFDPAAYRDDYALDHSEHVNGIIGASESTIGSLSICAEPLWRVPVRVLENLSRLEIFLGQHMENIALIFRYAGRLEHLSVLGLDDRAIFSSFEGHPDSLPSLRSFKILAPYRGWQPDVDVEELEILSIARFLRGKKELRALDVHLWPSETLSFAPFWDLLQQLSSLEVLGITTGVKVFTKDDFLSFATSLPPRLSALRVSAQWDIGEEEENEGCHSFVETLDKVSFFYMRNFGRSFAFLSNELAQELPFVEILGLDHVMSYVRRGEDNTVEVENWSARRCFTRTVEDFDGNEDWEWLMRHHDQGEWAW